MFKGLKKIFGRPIRNDDFIDAAEGVLESLSSSVPFRLWVNVWIEIKERYVRFG